LVSQRDDAQILPTPGSRVKEIPATFRQSPNFPGCPTRNSLPVCRTQQHAIAGLAKMNPNLLPAGYFSIVAIITVCEVRRKLLDPLTGFE